jgi:hypothetical protein
MKAKLSLLLAFVFGLIHPSPARPPTDPKGGLSELEVSVTEPSPYLDWAKKAFDTALTGVVGEQKASPRSAVSKSGQVVLWGNLFQVKDCYAVVELMAQSDVESENYGVAFAEWKDGIWQLRQLWKIPTFWRPEGWRESEPGSLPTTPATTPFELSDLGGGATPELIVAGETDRSFQDHYLLRFSQKTKMLNLVASAMSRPEVVGSYVRLYFKSPRRAIYEEWQFFKWKGDDLQPVASWHDEVGYGQNDPTFAEGERIKEGGKSETTRVQYGTGLEYNGDGYELTRDQKPFGKMRVTWKDPKNLNSMNSDEIEKAWLFEKITGLPRRFYPMLEKTKSVPKLEHVASVSVEGNAESARMFTSKP